MGVTMMWLWWWCTKLVIWWWSPGNGCQVQDNLATYRQQSLSNAPSKAPCLFRLFALCKYYFCIEWIFEQIWTFNNNMEFNFCGPPRGHTIWFHNKSQLSKCTHPPPPQLHCIIWGNQNNIVEVCHIGVDKKITGMNEKIEMSLIQSLSHQLSQIIGGKNRNEFDSKSVRSAVT